MLLSFVARFARVPKRKRNREPTMAQRLDCWACGLYETEPDICRQCKKCNGWTREHFETEHWRDRRIDHAFDEKRQLTGRD